MNAFFCGHEGLGDCLYMIGAMRFLKMFYHKIYFLCQDKFYSNVSLFFKNERRIVCFPYNSKDRNNACRKILGMVPFKDDILISGPGNKCHRPRIRNKRFLKYILKNHAKMNDSKYTLDIDMITSENYGFIKFFYHDIGLNLDIFFSHWNLDSTERSRELYNSIKQFKIIFVHTVCSTGAELNIDNLKEKYLQDASVIMISGDQNLYDKNTNNIKYTICQKFIKQKIIHYLDTIINASEIYVIDSCFLGIIIPLKKLGRLKAKIIKIVIRADTEEIKL